MLSALPGGVSVKPGRREILTERHNRCGPWVSLGFPVFISFPHAQSLGMRKVRVTPAAGTPPARGSQWVCRSGELTTCGTSLSVATPHSV